MTIQFDPPPMRLVNDSPFDLASKRRGDLQTLATALQTGNAVAAKNAIASMTIDAGATSNASKPTHANADQFHSDLKTLFDAVKSGDLAGAQQALQALTQDVPGYGPQGGSLTLSTWSITITFGAPAAAGTVGGTGTSATGANPSTGVLGATDSDGDSDGSGTGAAGATTAATIPATAPASDPMKALFDAVKAGDLSAAQQALQLLQSAAPGVKGHHGHHGHHGVKKPDSAPAAGSTDGTSSSPISKPTARFEGGPTLIPGTGTDSATPVGGSIDVIAPTL